VADDHPGVRAALAEVFDAQQDMEVVGQAADGVEAVQMARALVPDVITMDIAMPRLDGLAATRRITMAGLACRVLIVTGDDLEQYHRAAREAGALGLVEKGSSMAELLDAVRAIRTGIPLWRNASA
jgi:DNA-binding NarL/FixJ family response regulator